jgi:NADP-dependent alcohol dehydrogenase
LIDERGEKLLQMGENVFKMSTKNPNDVIDKIETMYKNLGVNLELSSYTQDTDINEKVTTLLTKHGFTHFGYNGSVNKEMVEKILNKSL